MRPSVNKRPRSVMWPRRVVLVDHQADSRSLASLLMRARGHRVLEASDVDGGFELIQKEVPDVVFVESTRHDTSAQDLARRVRAQPELASVLLVAVSDGTLEPERALAAGFDLHLTKPVSSDDLEHAMRHPGAANTGTPEADGNACIGSDVA
jgi:CheY-like chemotaxis protein